MPGAEAFDVDHFHRHELPRRLDAGHNTLAAAVTAGLRPLTFDIDGAIWSYVPSPQGVEVVEGQVAGAAEVTIDTRRFGAYVAELHTAMGLLYGGFAEGDLGALSRWEPAVRAAFHGRPPYDPARVDLHDLDPGRWFEADDVELGTLRLHMEVLGYAHVRGVFDADEIAAMDGEVKRLADLAHPGDDRSWWARGPDGGDVLCRLTHVEERSPLLAELHADPRLVGVVDALDCGAIAQPDRHDGHSVVIKNAGVTAGLSDLPWHVDCGLGGHPVLCPGVNVGIQLDAADADTGQLHVLAGSHHTTAWHLSPAELADAAFPTVAIDTRPGDVTFHFTDLLHAAPPPTGVGGRRTLYVSYTNPAALDVVPVGRGYNDVVLASGDGNRVRDISNQIGQSGSP